MFWADPSQARSLAREWLSEMSACWYLLRRSISFLMHDIAQNSTVSDYLKLQRTISDKNKKQSIEINMDCESFLSHIYIYTYMYGLASRRTHFFCKADKSFEALSILISSRPHPRLFNKYFIFLKMSNFLEYFFHFF